MQNAITGKLNDLNLVISRLIVRYTVISDNRRWKRVINDAETVRI